MENKPTIDLEDIVNHILKAEPSMKLPKQIGPTITLQKNSNLL